MKSLYDIKLNIEEMINVRDLFGMDFLRTELFNDFSESRVKEIIRQMRKYENVDIKFLEDE